MTVLPRIAALLAGLCLLEARAGEMRLPPITGELSGDFLPVKIAGAPAVHWTLTLQNPSPGERMAVFTAKGPELQVQAEIRLDAAGAGTWRVIEAHLGLKPWLGGQLTSGDVVATGAGTFRDGSVTGEFTLNVHGVDLGELLKLADVEKKYFQSARGSAEGTIGLHVRDGTVSRGEIALTIPGGTSALILFQPSPGLLSSYVPAALRRKYPGIEAIELGKTPLEAKVLRLSYSPTTDAAGRSAVVHLEGQPQDRKYIAPLELDVNFLGQVELAMDGFLKLLAKFGALK